MFKLVKNFQIHKGMKINFSSLRRMQTNLAQAATNNLMKLSNCNFTLNNAKEFEYTDNSNENVNSQENIENKPKESIFNKKEATKYVLDKVK